MGQISNIFNGWKLYLSKETPLFTKQRAEICQACPVAKVGTVEQWLPETNELKQIQGLKCGVCKCPLSAKLRSPDETCPLKKW